MYSNIKTCAKKYFKYRDPGYGYYYEYTNNMILCSIDIYEDANDMVNIFATNELSTCHHNSWGNSNASYFNGITIYNLPPIIRIYMFIDVYYIL